ncbi:methyltransferase family protein [Azonexus fungiphilus]|uniref:Methyltransferase family protein n=1 Tax=Azonexus fungiphilus TaxID=146940 RepID=A0A495WFU9_9RHOO|nr:class I SAM-dependent methyltransferase [Azonexus fungiphilus]RKT59645.1 methyltransferase family protein [Azonexus fungiphilus]
MKIKKCRLCQSEHIEKVVDLGFHPLADTFLPEELLLGPEVSVPLQLGLCRSCGHVFTLYSVSAVERYQKQDYSYDSSNSKVSIAHFKEFSDAVLAVKQPEKNSLIVDIGSNIGTLLSHFQGVGYDNVLGVEPSGNISALAIKAGVPTINDFFSTAIVEHLKGLGAVQVLLSANVLNHADDLGALLETAKQVLAEDGVFVFEVPYLLDLVQGTAFDTIYHEHVHYYGIQPLSAALQRSGFSIFQVDRLDYMCGSIRVYTRLGGTHAQVVESMIENERSFRLYEAETFRAFMERVRKVKTTVVAHLANIKLAGGKIIGIGAATKGNTFLNYCRLDADVIAYVADASPLKIGKMTPGSHIPIIADQDIDEAATHALILPWNIAPMLQAKLSHLGLEFYVPQVETLNNATH